MENKKIRVLYFVDRMLKGGIQSLVFEIAKRINKDKFQLDFLLLDDGNKYELEEKLKEFGCNVYKLDGIWVETLIDFLKYGKAVDHFFKIHNNYDIVHMHSSSKNYLILKKAKKYGIKTRIAHSHNIDFQTKNIIKKIIGNIFKINLRIYATDYYACSKLAGEWLFGKNIVKSKKFKVINNAIDYNKFKFNKSTRKKIRDKLKIYDDEIIVGHIGRFTMQKNHEFLIKIFYELYKINSKFKLIMIGTGIKEKEIRRKVEELNITKNVIFEGFKENVNEYIQAMDLFLFPSKFEGLGIVLIEAQASGLKCYVSKDVIPKEAQVTSLLKFIDLKSSPEYWAKEICKDSSYQRKDVKDEFENKKYFIEDTIEFLETEYASLRRIM